MAAIDTNVLVRLVMEDDPDQAQRARSFLRRNAPVYVSQLCLMEFAWVLGSVYQRPKGAILQALRTFLENADLEPEAPAVLEAALIRWEASEADLPDCLLLEGTLAQGKAPLGTFDRKLSRLEGAVLL